MSSFLQVFTNRNLQPSTIQARTCQTCRCCCGIPTTSPKEPSRKPVENLQKTCRKLWTTMFSLNGPWPFLVNCVLLRLECSKELGTSENLNQLIQTFWKLKWAEKRYPQPHKGLFGSQRGAHSGRKLNENVHFGCQYADQDRNNLWKPNGLDANGGSGALQNIIKKLPKACVLDAQRWP